MKTNENEMRQRDVMTLRILGIFFSMMGALVLIATYETLGNTPAMVVSLCSGFTLAGVGVGMILASRRLSKQDPEP